MSYRDVYIAERSMELQTDMHASRAEMGWHMRAAGFVPARRLQHPLRLLLFRSGQALAILGQRLEQHATLLSGAIPRP